MRRKQKSSISNAFYTLGIVTLFIGGFLLLVVFGATSYRNVVLSQESNNHTRELSAYLSLTIQTNKKGKIYTYQEKGIDSKVLVVQDGNSSYAFRIYNYGGNLVEDYGKMDGELYPEDANVLGENSKFVLREVKEGLLAIETDAGITYVAVEDYEGEK